MQDYGSAQAPSLSYVLENEAWLHVNPARELATSASPTHLPTMMVLNSTSVFGSVASYGPWWVVFVIIIGVLIFLYCMVRKVLQAAEEKKKRIEANIKKLKARIMAGDDFMKEHKYSWDWVIVFQVADGDESPTEFQRKFSVRNVVTRLSEAGLQTSMFYSVDQVRVHRTKRRPSICSAVMTHPSTFKWSLPELFEVVVVSPAVCLFGHRVRSTARFGHIRSG
jgi:hypothetical protein